MRAGSVAMRLLVGADGEFRDMALGIVISHLEHRVDTAGAALLPAIEQHVGGIGDKIGFPHAPSEKFALAAEIILLAGVARRKHVGIVKNKIAVAIQAHHRRRIGDRDITRRLLAAAVKVLVPTIEWNGKKAAGLPLKAAFLF